MTTAREIMTADPCIVGTDTVATEVAQLFSTQDVGAAVVCNDEKRLQGMVTDRDLAVGVVGQGRDAGQTTAGDLVDGTEVVTIGADDSIDEAIATMKEHAVRRLPVVDGTDVIGILSQADLAGCVSGDQVTDLLTTISAAPDNTLRG